MGSAASLPATQAEAEQSIPLQLAKTNQTQSAPQLISTTHTVNGASSTDMAASALADSIAHIPKVSNMQSILSSKQLNAKARERFDVLDVDKDGELSKAEVAGLVDWICTEHERSGGMQYSLDKATVAERLFFIVDSNFDGSITFDEFAILYDEITIRAHLLANASEKFKELDLDGNGKLEKDEILSVANWLFKEYEKIGMTPEHTAQVSDQILKRLDSKGDKQLDMFEFSLLFDHVASNVRAMNNARALFNELDTEKTGVLGPNKIEVLAERLLRMYNYHPNGVTVTKEEKSSMMTKLMRRLQTSGYQEIDLHVFSFIFTEISDLMLMFSQAKIKFDELDKDKNGVLTAAEMDEVTRWALSEFETVINYGDVQALLTAAVDSLRSNGTSLTFKNFIQIFTDVTNKVKAMKRAACKFEELDVDKSGYLELTELRTIVDWMLSSHSSGGAFVDEEEKQAMLDEFLSTMDIDKDGRFSLFEFSAVFDQVEQKRKRRRTSMTGVFKPVF